MHIRCMRHNGAMSEYAHNTLGYLIEVAEAFAATHSHLDHRGISSRREADGTFTLSVGIEPERADQLPSSFEFDGHNVKIVASPDYDPERWVAIAE